MGGNSAWSFWVLQLGKLLVGLVHPTPTVKLRLEPTDVNEVLPASGHPVLCASSWTRRHIAHIGPMSGDQKRLLCSFQYSVINRGEHSLRPVEL